ncbi:MAG: cupin domain-containing protein [Ilumatobacteraceae bacterium]
MTPEAPPAEPAGGALSRCVGDVEEFETECWGRRPLVRSSGAFDDIWSVAALDDMLAGGVRRPLIRLVQRGDPIPGERYTSRVRLGGSDFRDVIDPGKVADMFRGGATIVAQSLHRTHPSVRRFAEQLADEISHPIQANSYLTPADSVGLARHTDNHDVFVLQVEGSKSWSIAGLGDVELRPGDTVYIPAGTEHSAASTVEPSLHLTIGVLRVTYRAVIERFMQSGPPVLDDPLPLRYRSASADLPMSIGAVLSEVATHLRSADPAEIANAETARPAGRPPRAGALRAAVETSAIRAETALVATDDRWAFAELAGERVEISAGDCRLSAPTSCRRAFEQLDRERRCTVGDLDGLDTDSQVILARRLVTAGFCHVDR